MRFKMNTVLVCGIAFFVGLAIFFWTVTNLTHVRCCSQEWVNEASDSITRAKRAETRARSVAEVNTLKGRSQAYALACMVGAASLAMLYYRVKKKAPSG